MVFNGFFVAWFGKNIFLSFTLSSLGWLTLLTWGLRSRQNNPSRQQTLILLLQLQQLPARSFQVRKHQSFQARPFASFFETWSSACHFLYNLSQIKWKINYEWLVHQCVLPWRTCRCHRQHGLFLGCDLFWNATILSWTATICPYRLPISHLCRRCWAWQASRRMAASSHWQSWTPFNAARLR